MEGTGNDEESLTSELRLTFVEADRRDLASSEAHRLDPTSRLLAAARKVPERSSQELRRRKVAFTLVEILMVIAIMLLLLTLAAPVISSMVRAGSVTYATNVLGSFLENARALSLIHI